MRETRVISTSARYQIMNFESTKEFLLQIDCIDMQID